MTSPDAYCRECGTAISPNAADCPDCGAPQASDRDGRLTLFTSLIMAVAGLIIWPIIFGPIGAVTGFDAYAKRGGYLTAAACALGVINTVFGAVTVAMSMGYA